MQIDKILKKAMIDKDIKSFRQLSEVSGVAYQTVVNIMGGSNASLKTVSKLFKSMGFELIARPIK